jgi:hypothetical protein
MPKWQENMVPAPVVEQAIPTAAAWKVEFTGLTQTLGQL